MKATYLSFGSVILALAIVCSPAHAQRVIQGDIQQQMSPEQFHAAGLDKLSPAELAALNRWLQGNVEKVVETAVQTAVVQATADVAEKAREEGRQEIIVKNRGFLAFGSSEPIEAILPGTFNGFAKNREYALDNGQVWQQTSTTTLHGARRENARIKITPGAMGAWYMQVDGFNTRATVRRIK